MERASSVDCSSLQVIAFGTIAQSLDFDNASLCCLSCKSITVRSSCSGNRVMARMHAASHGYIRKLLAAQT